MNAKAIEKTELNKILEAAADYAVLDGGKERLKSCEPADTVAEAKRRLTRTQECVKLLFTYGLPKVEYFEPLGDMLTRAEKGAALSCAELLTAANLLRSVRIVRESVAGVTDPEIVEMKRLADGLYYDRNLEDDIVGKILSETEIADQASEKLFALRREIRALNDRIKARLGEYLTGAEGKYLQEGIVTMRDNRYVLPVRAEYKRSVKGFIHDRSASGATFFIEPEEVLEMNNELRSLTLDEREEVERILKELSSRLGRMKEELTAAQEILEETDGYYARAEYAYSLSAVRPEINDKGVIEIEGGRHPLIDKKKVVPVSLALGKEYRWLLISGPNTGGKTVTLKMAGLFCLMAACGLFLPAKSACVAVFKEIYCDMGDAQSIEESLSTFSSHMKTLVSIVEKADSSSLVLLDEPGGGTDPEEGQALARAVVEYLLKTGCTGIATTHYSSLKEFAFSARGIENASMQFDAQTLQPLYVIRLGLAGASNALAIARKWGLKEEILNAAASYLSEDSQKLNNIVRRAEESRQKSEELFIERGKDVAALKDKIAEAEEERRKLSAEREKLQAGAKAELRRRISEKAAEAEDLLFQMEEIFKKSELTEGDLITARTLKNKLIGKAYEAEEEEESKARYLPADKDKLQIGDTVFIDTVGKTGTVLSVRKEKNEAEVSCGEIKLRVKISSLSALINDGNGQNKKGVPARREARGGKGGNSAENNIKVTKNLAPRLAPSLEINVIGETVAEAVPDVEAFLDSALISNLEEVRIVHGVGGGKLRAAIHELLRKDPRVKEFRPGRYGEGEAGVTVVKFK
ncbi:MAG: endonuclease MutS2 [Candidatus Borkfalkiaceae bacterium]|nr:endonuclease MutS2 [Clostridia bacterium]MDY6222867.1 endonuclease MutS2 [Christensenellaceae bacterium]